MKTSAKQGICKLCLSENKLEESHYVSAGLFRASTIDGKPPVLTSPTLMMATNKALVTPLLCRACEQRLNKLGENYSLPLINTTQEFRLFDIVRSATRREPAGAFTKYFGKELNVDTDALAYFALSTIWRGSVFPWRTFHGVTGVDLGKHEEPVRSFLHGSGQFPPNVVVNLIVGTDFYSKEIVIFPFKRSMSADSAAYSFVARGLYFDVVVGDNLPPESLAQCCVNTPGKVFFVGDLQSQIEQVIGPNLKTARRTKSLLKLESPGER
jgi:hypothetical protein